MFYATLTVVIRTASRHWALQHIPNVHYYKFNEKSNVVGACWYYYCIQWRLEKDINQILGRLYFDLNQDPWKTITCIVLNCCRPLMSATLSVHCAFHSVTQTRENGCQHSLKLLSCDFTFYKCASSTGNFHCVSSLCRLVY